MKKIVNPILKGFNPDPSMIRVGDDFYIATSTFEWFPGVQIHHSRDMVNWRLLTHPLDRVSQLDMMGVPDSCGIWAPCLTYHQGMYYLVYTIVRTFDGRWKDLKNYLVTCNSIDGDWSEPVFLNSSGFDASLFHDEDGKKWVVNMLVDHRKGKFFGGILLQEFSVDEQKLVGPVHHIFEGTELGITEGPHIYKRNSWYYLMTAEGGTEYGHAVSLARSREITGPYEVHPTNPVLTARNNPDLPLQRTGHASIIETKEGDWFMAYLAGRPLTKLGRCTLGRETALARVDWRDDDWLYLSKEGNEPDLEISGPGYEEKLWPVLPEKDDFDSSELDINFQSLRIPITEEWASLTARPGYLRLQGRESLRSIFEQSLIARRQQAFHTEAATCVDFQPEVFQQKAGLICFYNTRHFHYLYLAWNEDMNTRSLGILTNDYMDFTDQIEELPVSPTGPIYLKAIVNKHKLQFYFGERSGEWQPIGPVLDASILSDDYAREKGDEYKAAFTGSFVGMCCQDLSGQGLHADFDWFSYKEID